MAKGIDFIAIRVTLFFITIAWCVYLFNSIILAIVIGISVFILMNILFDTISKRKRPCTFNQLAIYLTLYNHTVKLIAELLPNNINYTIDKKSILTEKGELIYVDYSLKPFSQSNAIAAIKLAVSKQAKMLTIATTSIDRNIYTIFNRYDIPINIINIKHTMKLLIKKEIMPNVKKTGRKLHLSHIFNRKNASRFFLSSCIIALTSLIIPIKIYYLILSGICFLLGALSVLIPLKSTPLKSSILSPQITEDKEEDII